jgi:hypothetical protein
MVRAVSEDWPEGSIVVVPHAWRDDDLWLEMQHQAQERIGTTLREMYAELLQEPLSPGLERLVGHIQTRSETLPYAC